MRKHLLLIGVIILVLGVSFSVSGLYATHDYAPVTTQSMTLWSTGVWTSANINISAGSIFEITSTTNCTFLVRSTILPFVNTSNIPKYEILPVTTSTVSSVHTMTFDNISGSFNVVSTASVKPTVETTLISDPGLLAAFGILLLIGIVTAIAGIIMTIMGAILKPKNPPRIKNYGFNR